MYIVLAITKRCFGGILSSDSELMMKGSCAVAVSMQKSTMNKIAQKRLERLMSRCFTWFPISGLGEPNI